MVFNILTIKSELKHLLIKRRNKLRKDFKKDYISLQNTLIEYIKDYLGVLELDNEENNLFSNTKSTGITEEEIYKGIKTINIVVNEIDREDFFQSLNAKILELCREDEKNIQLIDLIFNVKEYSKELGFNILTTNENLNLRYTEQYFDFLMNNIIDSHFYLSRLFLEKFDPYLKNYFSDFFNSEKTYKYNFLTLLQNGPDELKPLVLYSKNIDFEGKHLNYYLHLICIDNYKDKNRLLEEIIDWYNQELLPLEIPIITPKSKKKSVKTAKTSVKTPETSVKTLKTSVKTPETSVKTLKTSVKTPETSVKSTLLNSW